MNLFKIIIRLIIYIYYNIYIYCFFFPLKKKIILNIVIYYSYINYILFY